MNPPSNKPQIAQPKGRRIIWPFLLWLALFYGAWTWLVWHGDYLATVLQHWPVALAMTAGSYVAGSTPMGGGTIGFPLLVLLLEQPATLGRDFSFAVQSVGMTSASIYILCRRQPLEWRMLLGALPGALIGTPLGIVFLAPLVGDLAIKIIFAAMWCSFGLLHLARINVLTGFHGITPVAPRFDYQMGFAVGLLGSLTVTSVTGVGLDMLLYMVLVLLCHADLKIAIPTSVILMAFASLLGIFTKMALGTVDPGIFGHWLAAAPIVALGAPLGALVVARIGRRPTLLLVSVLCVLQFVWMLVHERLQLSPAIVALAFLAVGIFLMVFAVLARRGDRIARRSGTEGK